MGIVQGIVTLTGNVVFSSKFEAVQVWVMTCSVKQSSQIQMPPVIKKDRQMKEAVKILCLWVAEFVKLSHEHPILPQTCGHHIDSLTGRVGFQPRSHDRIGALGVQTTI